MRVRALILCDGNVALIERRNSNRGRLYYLFPGGGVESGESVSQAVVREVKEELGLDVILQTHIADVTFAGEVHRFLHCSVVGGTFGTGHGDEMTGRTPQENGTYLPLWIPIHELKELPVFPQRIASIVMNVATDGWPDNPLAFIEHTNSDENER